MKISTKNNKLIIELDKIQKSYDATGEHTHNTDALIGVIEGDEFGLAHIIDLGYKGTQNYSPIFLNLHFDMDEDDFRKLCKDNDIDIIESVII